MSSEWGLNCQPSGYWTTTLTTEPQPPQIQMYDKNMHINVWKKQAYKCMKKTRIQMYEKNRHTNTHTNVWKKRIQMYEKKGIQKYEKNMHTNTHTNVWKKQAYKCMIKTCIKCIKKTGIQMYDKNMLTNVWKKHAYKCSHDKEVNCYPSSCQPTNPFFEQWVGIELPTLWLLDDHTHHWATADPNT